MSQFVRRIVLASILGAAILAFGSDADAQDLQQCIASNERSIALRRGGKLREALEELRTCAADACVADIQNVCRQRIAEIHAALPSVVFEAKDGSGHDLIAVKVSVDKKQIAQRLEGAAIPLDPGEHEFTFEVDGRPPVNKRLLIREGEKSRHETVVFAMAPTRQSSAKEEEKGSRATTGLLIGGVGAAALVGGTVLGVLASSKWHDSKTECGAPGCDPVAHAAAIADHDTASNLALASTIAFLVGGGALLAGAALFFTAPSRADEVTASGKLHIAPSLGAQYAGVAAKGSF